MPHSTYTQATYYFDYDAATIQSLIADVKEDTKQEQIAKVYTKVRDRWRYSPFNISFRKENYRSSALYHKKEAHCIEKAILLISALRALDIPARLRLAKVSNHIATERLEKKLGTNELAPHGLVDVFHNDRWVKCSPAFNKELCDMYQVDVLDFDGTADSIMQEYNRENEKLMSYIEEYGHFDDVPMDYIDEIFKINYPDLYEEFKSASN